MKLQQHHLPLWRWREKRIHFPQKRKPRSADFHKYLNWFFLLEAISTSVSIPPRWDAQVQANLGSFYDTTNFINLCSTLWVTPAIFECLMVLRLDLCNSSWRMKGKTFSWMFITKPFEFDSFDNFEYSVNTEGHLDCKFNSTEMKAERDEILYFNLSLAVWLLVMYTRR